MTELPERFRSRHVAGLELAFRAKGGDDRKPFIDVLAGSMPLSDLAPLVRREWPRVGVARLLQRGAPEGGVPDQHVLLGIVGDLQALPPLPPPAGFVVAQSTPAAQTAYFPALERFRAEAPLGPEVWPCTPQQLAEAAADGALVAARGPDAQWAGLAVCSPGSVAGWSGQVMQELFVAADARGRGLATALQRALIDALSPEDVLLGTIHAANAPSLATALRCGRAVVATYWWIPLREQTWLDAAPTTG